ncbi:hypothetical protein [Desulfosediminicola flagellatus]|uniref:hypothetical protein n=1 Tax=Desulfosediminicola flagellatus TaxID=2569541 RepID=UPI0010AD7145|nr:hypothetical protein [Desulfosediminicola flagellatus]
MDTPIIAKEMVEVNVDFSEEVTSFGMMSGAVAGVFIAVLAGICLISALISSGPVEMLRGYITALTGY